MMKLQGKYWMPALALLFSGITVQAQTGFYLQASLNACNVTGTGFNTFQKPGVYASFGKSEDLEWLKGGLLQYGLAFSQKGARKAPDPKNNDFIEYNIRLNYAEIPVNLLFKMRTIKGLFGLSAGYLVSQSERGLNGTPVTTPTKYKKLDFMASVGFSVPIGGRVFLGLKGAMSILPIVPLSGATSIAFSRGSRNQVISVGLTFVFVKTPEVNQESE